MTPEIAEQKLLHKLVRELAQAEHDAALHTTRQARRLGDCPPSHAMLAIADHARWVWPAFAAAAGPERRVGRAMGRFVAKVFSASRYLVIDRLIDAQRTYRATLLGLRHGLDCAHLLRHVAARAGHLKLVRWCDVVLPRRAALLDEATDASAWFAECPDLAIRSFRTSAPPRATLVAGAR